MSALPQYLPDCLEQASSLPVGAGTVSAPSPTRVLWHTLLAPGVRQALGTIWTFLRRQGNGLGLLQARQRRLRVRETVSLGEKRFVSILEVDGQAFLLGGSGTGVTLLATLSSTSETVPFERVLQDSLAQGEAR